MRYYFIFLLFIIFSISASAQILHDNVQFGEKWKNTQSDSSLGIPKDTFNLKASLRNNPKISAKGDSVFLWSVRQQKYILITGGGGSSIGVSFYGLNNTNDSTILLLSNGTRYAARADTTEIIPGGPISSLPTIGFNPGVNITAAKFIDSVFYQSQPPTATLSGGGIYEFTTAGSTSRVLSWTGGRQSATATLATINVDGVNQSFTQPAQGGSVAGTKNATVPHNTNTNYSNIVTTTDGKSATATTSFTYQNKIYAGFVTSNNPSDADIIAATGSTYVGGQFSGARNQSGALSTPSSSKYFIFAAPASYGTPNISINGLGATLNLITRSFTNASGFTSSYIIAVSPFSTSGGIDSYIVN